MNEIKISSKASRVGIIFGDKRSINQLKYRLFGICIHRNKKNEENRRKHKKQFDIIEEAKIQGCEIPNDKN